MDRFKIYTPENKFYISNNLVVYSLLGLFIIPPSFELYILKSENDEVSKFSVIMMIAAFAVMIIGMILNMLAFRRYKPLNGTLDGEIIFGNDTIIFNTKVFEVSSLSKISFSANDFKGLRTATKGEFDGCLSQGVDNKVTLYRNNKLHTYYFQLLYKDQLRDIREQLIQYHLAGKLHFQQLIDILGITKYDDIQEFKREIGNAAKQ